MSDAAGADDEVEGAGDETGRGTAVRSWGEAEVGAAGVGWDVWSGNFVCDGEGARGSG